MRSTMVPTFSMTIQPTSRSARNRMPSEVRIAGNETFFEQATDATAALDSTFPTRGRTAWGGGINAPERNSSQIRAGTTTGAWHAKLFDCGASDIYIETKCTRNGAANAQTFFRIMFRGITNVFSPADCWIYGTDINGANPVNGGKVVSGVYTSSYSGSSHTDGDKYAAYCKNGTIIFLQNDNVLVRIADTTFMHGTYVGLMLFNVATQSQVPRVYDFQGWQYGGAR